MKFLDSTVPKKKKFKLKAILISIVLIDSQSTYVFYMQCVENESKTHVLVKILNKLFGLTLFSLLKRSKLSVVILRTID